MQLRQRVCNSLAAPWATWRRREWNVKFFNTTPTASPFTGEKTCRYQLGIFRKRKESTLFQLWKGTRLKSFVLDGQGYAGLNRRPESLSPTVCFSCPPQTKPTPIPGVYPSPLPRIKNVRSSQHTCSRTGIWSEGDKGRFCWSVVLASTLREKGEKLS